MKKRGQVSIEFVITVGFAFLILIPLAVLLYEHSTKTYVEVNNNQAGLIARKITDAANKVYYLGYPSSMTLKLYFPEKVDSVSIAGKELILHSQSNDIVSAANINLTGNFSSSSGIKYIRVSALKDMVNITEDGK